MPTRFRDGPGLSGSGGGDPQSRIIREYEDLGLNYGRDPRYDPRLADYGATDASGVRIGDLAALGSRGVLRSTLVHEGTHVAQLRAGNYAKGGTIAGNVNEAEAYRQELLSADRTGLSEAERNRVGVDYYKRIDRLFDQGSVGNYYLRRMLIYEDFSLRAQDVTTAPIPDWVR